MIIKIFFGPPNVKYLKESGHKIKQFSNLELSFINKFKKRWNNKKTAYLKYLKSTFINQPKKITVFISYSKDKIGGCNKLPQKNSYIVYVAYKQINPILEILFHELCHVFINNESKIQEKCKKKQYPYFEIEELFAQLLTLKYLKKTKYIKHIPNRIFKKLHKNFINKIKHEFKRFNKNKKLLYWFETI